MTAAERSLRENAEAMGLPVFPTEPADSAFTPDEAMALRLFAFKHWSDT